MPVGWFTLGTPEELTDLLGRGEYDAFEDAVDRRVADAGAVTMHVLWEDAGASAHVVVAVPERNADEIFTLLEDSFETPVTRLRNVQELKRGSDSTSA